MAEFAHLHLHTEFSLLDGMGRIDEYVSRAQELGIKHMAVTDHGVMYAALSWYQAATSAGLHPIIGMEAYLAEGPIAKRERKSYHLLLLAENEIGYRNLIKLASIASLHGFYYRPRIDMELLQQYREGIICTSACLGGPVANNFLHGKGDLARRYAGELAEIFGPERFYIEIQDHGLKEQHQTNADMIPLARSLGLPLVATNDVHYCGEHDAGAQDVLVCVQTNTTIHDPKRLKSETNQLFLKSPEEMAKLFSANPEALKNTIRIAEMCNVDLSFKGYHLPEFQVPDGHNAKTYLRYLCEQGAIERYGTLEGEVGQRLDYELGIIESMGFNSYFLITWDFVDFAKRNGILVGPGRGSAAGSIVCYCLNITGLDPLKHRLIFERFLNPSRISMPDIDIDFADDRRSEVIDYVVRKYGDDRVAQIITFGTLKAKAAVRDVGRAMGLSFADTDRVAKLIPTDPKMTINLALETVPELNKLLDQEPSLRELVETAKRVEGHARHSSTHAAGVVISGEPLMDHLPLQRAGGKSEGEITTQFPMTQMEDIGLLKMDFLGLKTLTVIRKALDHVREAGNDLSIEDIPLDDPIAMQGLCRGETAGVFQLEGGMTTRMTVDVAPTGFDDIVALSALIRPGPMQMAPDYIARKHGRAEIEYLHPLMEPILKETQGVPLYQEQVMQIANALAGFSMAESDGLRKAMGKKLPAEMAKYRDRFVEGCTANNISARVANDVFEMIERFAGYGFPKAHSAAYGVITAQTAYLKANYPVQFMAALMTTEMGSTDKTVFNVVECRRSGIQLLPPDVNKSVYEFSVEEHEGGLAIRFGLGAVKNVGQGAVESILASRQATPNGEFATLEAFCDAVDWSAVNKRVAECLVKVGALSALGERAQLLDSLEHLIAAAQGRQRAAARGQMDLFGGMPDVAPASAPVRIGTVAEADRKQVLAWEKELLGLYLSSHPLLDYTGQGAPDGYSLVAEMAEKSPGAKVSMIGMITSVRRVTTKTNRTMAIMEVEDLTGSIEIVAFPDSYESSSELIQEDAILKFVAKIDERGERHQLIVDQMSADLPAPQVQVEVLPTVVLVVPASSEVWDDISAMQRADEILRRHEGPYPVEIRVQDGSLLRRFRSRTRAVEWTDRLREELESIVGQGGLFLDEGRMLERAEIGEVSLSVA